MTPTKKPLAWGWIILAIIFFWPLGLFLLFRRLLFDKTATRKNSRIVANTSYVLMVFGVIYLIMAFTDDSSMFTAFLVFFGAGVGVNIISRNMKKAGERYEQYVSLVTIHRQTSIAELASNVGVNYQTAVKDLIKMIEIGYFPNAQIDHRSQSIVLPNYQPQESGATYEAQYAATAVLPQARVVACPSCGANNTITGQVGECEYCGSSIS